MTKINPTDVKTQILRIKNKAVEKMPTLEEELKAMVARLIDKERAVPDYGDFAPVFERIENVDKNLSASHFVLEISKPAKEVVADPKARQLMAYAYNLSEHGYNATNLMATGTKEEVFKTLKSPEFMAQFSQTCKKLAHDLRAL